MNTSSDIWFTFARSFGMLFLVLAAIIFAFYLVKKFSTSKSIRGNKSFIDVLAVHHLSPKEKLVLLKVVDEVILVGVTPSNISKISNIKNSIDFQAEENSQAISFSKYLSEKIKNPFSAIKVGDLDTDFQKEIVKKEGEG